jgi:uncharacterized protein (TIGR02231 family)
VSGGRVSQGAVSLVGMTLLDAPIVAVTVFPDRARVIRRGQIELTAGEQRVRFGPLPLGLLRDSVRISGEGPATVLGVDVVTRRRAKPSHAPVAALQARLKEIEAAIGRLDDANEVAEQREKFLNRVAMRAAGTLEPSQTGPVADDLGAQLAAVKESVRENNRQRDDLVDELNAVQREIDDLTRQTQPDELQAEVTLEADEAGVFEFELAYVTTGASWHSTYDLRLAGDDLALSWYGMVSQRTGEDWPECLLKLSTARPSGSLAVPELDPWYVDRFRPMPPPMQPMAYGAVSMDMAAGGAMPAPAAAPKMARARVAEAVAVAEQGPAAATYTPARPVAVPSDGTTHRTVVAKLQLEAKLDHVTAPVHNTEATLRATVRNSTSHTLPDAAASLFHEGDFVGSTRVESWAPDEERELALGVDDRVRVERELVKRSATKATLGSTRRIEAEYLITVTNHSPRRIRLTVLDQLPVSRDAQITVKETLANPEPATRSDLGVLTWKSELDPNGRKEIRFGYRAETAKGIELTGWRD